MICTKCGRKPAVPREYFMHYRLPRASESSQCRDCQFDDDWGLHIPDAVPGKLPATDEVLAGGFNGSSLPVVWG